MRRVLKQVCIGAVVGVMMLGITAHEAFAFRMPLEPVDESKNSQGGYTNQKAYHDGQKFLEFNDNPKIRKFHLGEDWNGNEGRSSDLGHPIYPIGHGWVRYAQETGSPTWGYAVIVEHDNGICSFYGHVEDPDLSGTKNRIKVTVGQEVYPDKPIASIGDANGLYVDEAHLHFEILRCDEFPYLKTKPGPGYAANLSFNTIDLIDERLDPAAYVTRGLSSYAVPLVPGYNFVEAPFEVGVNLADTLVYAGVNGAKPIQSAATGKSPLIHDTILYQVGNGRWLEADVKIPRSLLVQRFHIYAYRASTLMLYGYSWKNPKFSRLDPVVTSALNASIRKAPSLSAQVVKSKPRGSRGFIDCPPSPQSCASVDADGYIWWWVAFTGDGTAGWVAQPWLRSSTQEFLTPNILNSPPANVQAVSTSPSQIQLAWEPIHAELAVAHYDVYRDGTFRSRVANERTFLDSGLKANTVYAYQVRGVNSRGSSPASTAVTAKTLVGTDRYRPVPPSGFRTTAVTENTVMLAWNLVLDAARYAVFRNGIRYVTVDVPGEFDNGLTPETTYVYWVVAIDKAGNESSRSATLTVQTLLPPPSSSPFKQGDVLEVFTTTAPIRILADDPASQIGEREAGDRGEAVTNFKIAGGELWRWLLFEDQPSGWIQERFLQIAVGPPKDHTPPATPCFVRADAVGPIGVNLEWCPVADNPGGSGVANYRLLRNGKKIFEGLEILHLDVGPPLGVPLRYTVVAVDTQGNVSPESNAIIVTLPIPLSGWSFSVGMRVAATTWVSPRILPDGWSQQSPPVPVGTQGAILEVGPITFEGAWARCV